MLVEMAKRAMPGRDSLFRKKVRQPVSVTFSRRHHRLLKDAQDRLGLSRSDVVGLLVECFASSVRIPHDLMVDDEP